MQRTFSDEELLAIAKKNSGGGGGGGTTNYNQLENKPQIGGVTLTGNKSASDLGLASEEDLAGKVNVSAVGVAGGVAGLGNDGKVPASQLPAQQELTAGLYIEFDGNEISVKRDITQTAQEIAYNFTIPSDYTLRVMKYLNGDLVDTTDYNFNSVVDPINLDSIMEVSKKAGGGFYWVVKNLIASTTQAADYSVELYALQQTTNYTQNFVTTIDADKKLIIQSELDAALADKVDKVAGKGLSENDYTDADKAKVEAAKNEFVGTLAQWEALTTAQKKAYDTYQITDDYSAGSGLPNYSTTEQLTGQKWIDGKDIYFRTWDFGSDLTVSRSIWTNTTVPVSGMSLVVDYSAIASDGAYRALDVAIDGDYVQLLSMRNSSDDTVRYLTLYYTKA